MFRQALLCLIGATAFAQLTPDQRVHDFLELAAAFNKFYAPANWKIEAVKTNLFNVAPYVERIRRVQTDAEYFAIQAEYVASLQDGHATFLVPSDFRASLGLGVDIYDGKVLIETISSRYPPATFSFRAGDELVSIDGVPVGQTLDRLSKLQSLGNERPTRRLASAYLTSRPQTVIPDAHLVPDQSTVVIRRAETGGDESYVLTWLKTGTPVVNLPRRPDLTVRSRSIEAPPTSSALERLANRNSRLAKPYIPRARGDGEDETRSSRALSGLGARTPYYALPSDFVRRRGTGSDNLFSGTFTSDGLRIGLIRIPTFSVAFGAARRNLRRELEAEVTFLQAQTDGLIVDVSRNPGGFCSADLASRLTNQTTQVYRDLLLPTLSDIQLYEEIVAEARMFGAEPWVIDLWQFALDSLRGAAAGNRSLTGPLPACFTDEFSFYPAEVDSYPPWRDASGAAAGYSKPLIVLQDDISASEAEHFSSLIQDNKRGPVVGIRSPGLGGRTGEIGGGYYGEASTGMTFSLTYRNSTNQAPGIPPSPYLETTGVIPDVVIDSMTRDNLVNQFRPFFGQVTQAIVNHIRSGGPR